MKTALLPEHDLKEEIIRLLHPKWHLVRAYYLVQDCRLTYEEVGIILSRCADRKWRPGKPYHPNTVKNYVRQGRIEVQYFRSPLWRLSAPARSYLERILPVESLAEDGAIDVVREFVRMYRTKRKPHGCGPKIWKEIVDAIE